MPTAVYYLKAMAEAYIVRRLTIRFGLLTESMAVRNLATGPEGTRNLLFPKIYYIGRNKPF